MTRLPAPVRAILEQPNFAHIATVLPDGAPHSVPVWVGLEGDCIAVLTSPGSRKARNIERVGDDLADGLGHAPVVEDLFDVEVEERCLLTRRQAAL